MASEKEPPARPKRETCAQYETQIEQIQKFRGMNVHAWFKKARRVSLLLVVFCTLRIALAQQPAIDFSYAGYGAGKPLPSVKAALRVLPSGADDTARIQGALDAVAARAINTDGFRGAVILAPGRFHVAGQLTLRASGVVLRGSGADRTTIVAEGMDRRALVEMGAHTLPETGAAIALKADATAGSRQLRLASLDGFRVSQHVVVLRPSTAEWINPLGMTNLPDNFASIRLDWKPGSRNLLWDRTVVAIHAEEKSIELDAPITMAMEQRWGGGSVALVTNDPTVEKIGIEDLTLESSFDPLHPADEEHAWIAVQIDAMEDGWVRNVIARHFVSSAVRVNQRARRITVVDCQSLAPIAEKAGYRRQSFVANGQQVLVVRCLGEDGMNDFASGMLASGPNVFLDCEARHALGASGSFESLAAGVLYEHVKVPDAKIQLIMSFDRAQGAGWTAANSLIWNSEAESLDALGVPEAQNRVVTSPHPLFDTQLADRTGLHVAQLFAHADTDATDAQASLFEGSAATLARKEELHPVEIRGGRFVVDGKVAWGESQTESWWKADLSPWTASGASVTRFLPGVTSQGQTEDLAALAVRLKHRGVLTIQVNPGLWYDRRRDGHTMEKRSDANAWAPFYEMPWARSGQGTAWDGLSRYDLTHYNNWYFARHRSFAHEAAKNGLLVFYDLYNTHNVLEIGPHWIDSPWRPANNINDTGLPEPPPLRYGDRNDLANEFFSTAYAPLKALHRAYIRHTLDELADQPNVIFGLAYQYAGPLSFEQFFLDTIAEWEQEHGRHVRVALTTSKKSSDAILADPIRSRQISVLDMRYWQMQPDGSEFAPEAGINRAFREQITAAFPNYSDVPPPTTERLAYHAIRAYHDRYPQLALMPMENGGGAMSLLMAGAAAPSALHPAPSAKIIAESAKVDCPPTADSIPRDCAPPDALREQTDDAIVQSFVARYLCRDLMTMEPRDGWTEDPDNNWTLAGNAQEPVLIYSLAGSLIELKNAVMAKSALWFNPRSGEQRTAHAEDNQRRVYKKPDTGEWLLLLAKH